MTINSTNASSLFHDRKLKGKLANKQTCECKSSAMQKYIFLLIRVAMGKYCWNDILLHYPLQQ